MADARLVAQIGESARSRVRIVLDDGLSFVLYKGEQRRYHLCEGQEIAQEVYKEIMEEVLPKRAKLRAMNLLKARAYTEKQLSDKLEAGGYPGRIVEEAMAYVRSYGYTDDRQYAADFVEYNKERKSRAVLFRDLLRKGISQEVIEEAWQEHASEYEGELEREQILSWIKKKNFIVSEATFAEKQKFSAFLYRKGFQIDAIRSALSLDITSI